MTIKFKKMIKFFDHITDLISRDKKNEYHKKLYYKNAPRKNV